MGRLVGWLQWRGGRGKEDSLRLFGGMRMGEGGVLGRGCGDEVGARCWRGGG